MGKTVLLFFVTSTCGKWRVHSESQYYGLFENYSDAFARALEEAEAAGTFGFMSAVLARPASSGAFEVRWRYGCEGGGAPERLEARSGHPVPDIGRP